MNHMVSLGVSLVVHSMTRIASFCTLSSFNRFVCAIVVRPSVLSVTVSTTHLCNRKRWHCAIPFAAIAFRTGMPFLHLSDVSLGGTLPMLLEMLLFVFILSQCFCFRLPIEKGSVGHNQ